MESGIYKITSIESGCIYIGSAVNIKKRFREHKHYLINNYHTNTHMQRSWNKYGKDKFNFEIVELIEDKNCLLQREQYHLDSYSETNEMFNMKRVCNSRYGVKVSQETLNKMSIATKKFMTPDRIARQLKNITSKEAVAKMGISKQKMVECTTLNTIFDSASNAAENLGIHVSTISKACLGKLKTAHGLTFEYI